MKAWLTNIDRRLIYLLVGLGAAAPLLVSFDLPIKATPPVRAVYDTVEEIARKEARGVVLISFDYDPGSEAELQPMARAILRHCFRRNLRVVGVSHWPGNTDLVEEAFVTAASDSGRKPGQDYVFMGFKTGGGALVIDMGQDFPGAFPKDVRGNDTRTMEVMQGIRSLRDFDYVIDLAAGTPGIETWIAYGQERYRFKMGGGCTAVIAPDQFPFLQAGQLNGLIGGLAGAAEYEVLIGKKDEAVGGMRPQSVVHVVVILLIATGNLFYFLSRRKGTESP
ncbi:MAG: hypothetical protein EXS64_04055 [Candidatus Latescibacteria bacterium]|nr:hypothetical protein [Candidatus Latescibacterota bacterium]